MLGTCYESFAVIVMRFLSLVLSVQFFNVGFWQCSIGVCVDRSVDDKGFIETVMQDLPGRLAVNKGQVRLPATCYQ